MKALDLAARARKGELGPVHLIVGSERLLVDRAVHALRRACVGDGPLGFNDDVFHGKGLTMTSVLSTARTVPMMAKTRFVLVRDAESIAPEELDKLVTYLDAPSPSTCLVLVADKLDGRTKVSKVLKSKGIWVDAEPLAPPAVKAFLLAEAQGRGHRLTSDATDALLDTLGGDLGALEDALERLSLYVGAGKPIDMDAVGACVSSTRVESIWALVDAVSASDRKRALQTTASLLADREAPLRILAMVARQLRIVAKMRQALADGQSPPEAAKAAGAPPFKARELAQAAKRFTMSELTASFDVLADTDLALKSSKRPDALILEEAVVRLAGTRARVSPQARLRQLRPAITS